MRNVTASLISIGLILPLMECPSCHATTPADARFCPSCGHVLAVRADERRVATVLFADLVGYTSFSEAKDPESVKEVVDRCFERLVVDIVSFGGVVDKIVGDAIVALFGAPVAHEDDAERAVRAALQMQQTIATFAEDSGVPIRMRVGVNTGEVLAGALRAGGEYTAMGDAVNVASRLQTHAVAGQVLVGPETYAQTSAVIRYDEVGDVVARGRGEPVRVWAALETLAPPGQRPRRMRTPLVGRDHELGVLCSALSLGLTASRPQLLLLLGEAGIGKSRLAEELAGFAEEKHGAEVLEGRCVPYGEANVWWPMATAIRQAAGIELSDSFEVTHEKGRKAIASLLAVDEDDEEVTRVTDGLLYLLDLPSPLSNIDPTRAREEALRSLEFALRHLAAKTPVVLVISELHWADEVVLEFVDRLPDRLKGLPLVVIGTARPDLDDRWTPRPGRHNVVVMHLDPLGPEAAQQMLASLLESEPTAELANMLIERSGGNPFFLEELAGLMHQAGHEGELPATLRGLVATRLDALAPAERRALDDAAVIGRLGTIDSLRALSDGHGKAIERLADCDLIVLDGPEWSFRSDLVREVAYDTLTKGERARRHAAFADWLRERALKEDREHELLEQLAHHYATAAEMVADLGRVDGVPEDVTDNALHFLERAYAQTERRELPITGLHLADHAVDLLRQPSSVRRQWQVRRARANAAARNLEEARCDVAAVLEEAKSAQDNEATAAALTALGDIQHKAQELVESAATLAEAVRLSREVGDRAGEARALRLLGRTDLFRGEYDPAENALELALDLFGALEDRQGQAWAQQNLAWISFMRGDASTADERLADSIALFKETGDFGGLSWALGLLAWVRLQQGDLAEADRLGRKVVDNVGDHGDKWAGAMMAVLLASTSLWRGDIDESIRRGQDARAAFAEIGDTTGELRALGPLVRAMVASGRTADGLALLDETALLANRETDPGSLQLDRMLSVATAVQLGDGRRALELAERVVPVKGTGFTAEILTGRGLAMLLGGRTSEAVDHLQEAVQSAQEDGPAANAGSAFALSLAVAGRPADALAQADDVLSRPAGTYLDRLILHFAKGFALLQQADEAGGMQELAAAVVVADSTSDRLAQAHARFAKASGLAALGSPEATSVAADAHARLAAMERERSDWADVFARAAAAAPNAA